MIVVNKFL